MVASVWKWSWIFNGTILTIFIIMIVIMEYDIFGFPRLGYECNDPSLSHKYTGDTITIMYILSICVVLPFFVILLVEFVVHSYELNYRNSWKKKTLLQALCFYSQYALGLVLLVLFVQVTKCIVREPRPHFFDTCKPDIVNCTGYVPKYKCTNKDHPKKVVKDSSRSFPSGHAAAGWFNAVHMMWYFQRRIPPSDYIVVPFFQCLFLAWAILCSLSRITDYRHHWWDVLAGSILGALFAIYTVKILSKNFGSYKEADLNEAIKNTPKQDK